MNTPTYDTLIIGQGLAGSLLGWHLLQQGQRIMIINREAPHSASRMAAGLINPVTGKRLVRSIGIEHLLPTALDLYHKLEAFFSDQFYHPAPMFRLFRSTDDIDQWRKRIKDPDYLPYLDTHIIDDHSAIHTPLGGFRQLQTGYLDTNSLLDHLAEYFQQHQASLTTTLDYEDIRIDTDGVTVNDLHARRLVFCEGYRATTNPWFDWLPFKPAKGEILSIEIEDCTIDEIINAGHWLLPLGDGRYRLGATYQWHPLDEQTSNTARQQLLQSLDKLLKGKFNIKVIEHQAGVRPCTQDTQPFVGLHPQHPSLGMFNGFGSKGALMIPHYAHKFSAALQHQTSDYQQADIRRYWTDGH